MQDNGLRKNKYGGWFNINDYMNKAIRKSYIDKNTMIKTVKDDSNIYGDDLRHKFVIDRKTGITMGQLDYVVNNNVPTVKMIRVYEEYRRKGYGTMLMKNLQKDYRGEEINLEILTNDGKKFFDKIAEFTEIKKGEYDNYYKGKIKED